MKYSTYMSICGMSALVMGIAAVNRDGWMEFFGVLLFVSALLSLIVHGPERNE